MPQCPKCNEPIRDRKWLWKLLWARYGRKVRLDCPHCGMGLLLTGTVKPGLYYSSAAILAAVILFTVFHRLFLREEASLTTVHFLVLAILLAEFLYMVAKAFGAKLVEAPPAKPFFDPDRLD